MRRGSNLGLVLGALAVAVVLSDGPSARGEPLQPEACESLKAEQSRLETLGVAQDLRRGPVAAQGSLTPARLKDVERLITVIEQIEFRCPRPPPPPAVKANAGKSGSASAGSTGEDETDKPKPKAKTKAAVKPAPGTAAPAAATGSTTEAAAKPTPRKKPVDAYIPPDDDPPARKPVPAPAQAKSPAAAAAPSIKPRLDQ